MEYITEAPSEVIKLYEDSPIASKRCLLLGELAGCHDLKNEIQAFLSSEGQQDSESYSTLCGLQKILDEDGEIAARGLVVQYFEQEKMDCYDSLVLLALLTDSQMNAVWRKLKNNSASAPEIFARSVLESLWSHDFDRMTPREAQNYRDQVAATANQLSSLVRLSPDLDRFMCTEGARFDCFVVKPFLGKAPLPSFPDLLHQLAKEVLRSGLDISDTYLTDPDCHLNISDDTSAQNAYRGVFNDCPAWELEYRQQVVDLSYKLADLVSYSQLASILDKVHIDTGSQWAIDKRARVLHIIKEGGKHAPPYPPAPRFYNLLKQAAREAEKLQRKVERKRVNTNNFARDYFSEALSKRLLSSKVTLSEYMIKKVVQTLSTSLLE